MTDPRFPEAMVESVAEAIRAEMNAHDPGDGWATLHERSKSNWRTLALAALTALADAGFVIMPREATDVLAWAVPLAELAIERHRTERVLHGRNDIYGTYKNGETWIGIYQSEVDQIEQARAMRDAAMGGKG